LETTASARIPGIYFVYSAAVEERCDGSGARRRIRTRMKRSLLPASALVLVVTACGAGAKPAPRVTEVRG